MSEGGRIDIRLLYLPEASTMSVMLGTFGTGMSSKVAFNLFPETKDAWLSREKIIQNKLKQFWNFTSKQYSGNSGVKLQTTIKVRIGNPGAKV